MQNGVSALRPKADMCGVNNNVRFGPEADINGQHHQWANSL